MAGPVRMEDLGGSPDGRRRSPSAARNRDEILPVLRRVLPEQGRVLELASGTGEHAVHFAGALPGITWQPTERDAEALASVHAWRATAALTNLLEPVELDIESLPWPMRGVDAVVAINLLHISPWSTTRALLAGAAQALQPNGRVFIYGAFVRAGIETAPSNLEFDRHLRQRDPRYGVRELVEVEAEALRVGLELAGVTAMPHNNCAVVLVRR